MADDGTGMTVSGYGPMRASDADREHVHGVLKSVYADGRLTWEDFDARSTAIVHAGPMTSWQA
ncbi:MAG: DUF1707 domain-containing protein [Actinomycetota bacterium]|nr:DUF1707 domain-containing protein [Actinomycetota bacterium]